MKAKELFLRKNLKTQKRGLLCSNYVPYIDS